MPRSRFHFFHLGRSARSGKHTRSIERRSRPRVLSWQANGRIRPSRGGARRARAETSGESRFSPGDRPVLPEPSEQRPAAHAEASRRLRLVAADGRHRPVISLRSSASMYSRRFSSSSGGGSGAAPALGVDSESVESRGSRLSSMEMSSVPQMIAQRSSTFCSSRKVPCQAFRAPWINCRSKTINET